MKMMYTRLIQFEYRKIFYRSASFWIMELAHVDLHAVFKENLGVISCPKRILSYYISLHL